MNDLARIAADKAAVERLAIRLHTVMEWSRKAELREAWDDTTYMHKVLVRYWVSDLLDELDKIGTL